ncbi:MAG: helix-turn-helix transcriptional regulator [Thermotogae bacterium]|jgi:transcriptional regulator with XRE-family HTH domain|nr:helix-turn-helix transcriptional regulator [Thermotogota bacterium]MCL5031909.1 helix-turn-helix transcriptional regulator [Thermotogota bacterium]
MNDKKIDELKQKAKEYYEWEKNNPDKIEQFEAESKIDPLEDFILEVFKERLNQNLTQEELAKKMNTKQSVISRFENGGREPSYEFMNRLAEVLGGNLYLTIHGDYTITVPEKYREKLKMLSKEKNMSVNQLLMDILDREINKERVASST